MTEDQVRKIIREEMASVLQGHVFTKSVQFLDGRNIQVGKTTGTKIGTETTQKLSVYGVTPIVQQGVIAAPIGGATQDAEARTAINSLITTLKTFGITA